MAGLSRCPPGTLPPGLLQARGNPAAVGSFHNVFAFSEEPDWEGLRRLEVRACLRGYERGGMWFLDVCPAHRLHGHVPFTKSFQASPIAFRRPSPRWSRA